MSGADNRAVRLFKKLWVIPSLVLAVSYVYLSVEHRALNLLFVQVHEGGVRNLLETVFYFEHFTRELPVSVLTAFALAVAFYVRSPVTSDGSHKLVQRRVSRVSAFAVALLLAVTVLSVAGNSGFRSFLLDLLQYRTRDDLISYGSHWRFHLLHLAFIFPAAIGLSFIYRGASGLASPRANPWSLLLGASWAAAFVLLAAVFKPTAEPFSDTRYLAHEIREIATHLPVTMLIAIYALTAYERRLINTAVQGGFDKGLFRSGMLYLFTAFLIPAFILIRLSGRDIMSVAQKQSGFSDLMSSHFFEHSLDYIFVCALTLLLYSLLIMLIGRADGRAS